MELAMIGLGRMGANMAQRLLRGGHRVIGFDPAEAARKGIEEKGGQSAATLEALVGKLKAPRTVWLMVPAGAVTDSTVTALTPRVGSVANACTDVSTPERTRKVPSSDSEKVRIASRMVQTFSALRFSITTAECNSAVPASHGISEAFSTGSQNHQPPQPSS